jgi:hypothetical protein
MAQGTTGKVPRPLIIREESGAVEVRNVNTITVSDGTLTDSGNGVVTIGTAGSGGGGGITIEQAQDTVGGMLANSGTVHFIYNDSTPSITAEVEDVPQSSITGLVADLAGKQPLDATLTALASFNTNGYIRQTSADTFTASTAIPQADVTNLVSDLAAKVPTSRTIGTNAPLTGGGDLSANRTLGVDSTVVITTSAQTLTNKTLTSPVVNVGSDATGDIYYRNGGGLLARLPIGSANQVLTVTSGVPSWATPAGGGGGPSIVKLTADQSTTNAAFVNITGLSFAVTNGVYYHFKFQLLYRSAVAGIGIGITATVPAFTRYGATVEIGAHAGSGGTDNVFVGFLAASGTAVQATGLAAINVDAIVNVEGILLPSANGTLQLQFKTETSPNSVTVRQGSFGMLWTLP